MTLAPAAPAKNIRSVMAKHKIIILIIILLAVGVGFYFRDDVIKLYNNFNKGVQDFQKTEIGNLITEIGKEVLTPPPLNIGGAKNQAVLTKAKIIAETNIQRYNQGDGLLPLFENQKLNEAALAKVNDMFLNQYFEHVSLAGTGPAELVQSFGYDYIATGENLILGNFASEKELVQAWMDSPGHRDNILNSRYTEIGVAIVKGNYKGDTVWLGVQEFGLPLSACSKPSDNLKNQIDSYKSQLDNLNVQINEKLGQLNNTNPRNKQYDDLVDQYNQLVRRYQSLAGEAKGFITQYNNQINIFNQCVSGN